MEEYKTIKENVEAEIVEKKSKFIAKFIKVEDSKQAVQALEEIRKKHHDARHHCYAYRVVEEERIVEKASDDGEPSGTAGAPILSILQKNELSNVIVVVTRYFGGILLGTGGLVRAYTESTKVAMEKVQILKLEKGYELEIELEYSQLENWKYYCRKRNINIINVEYDSNILLTIELTEKQEQELEWNIEQNSIKLKNRRKIRKKYIQKNL